MKQTNQGFRIILTKKEFKNLDDFDFLDKIFQFNYSKNYNTLNNNQKALHNWWIISGDVENGGFIQYFENTKGEFNYDGLVALKLIGDLKMHKIFSDAVKIFEKNRKHFTTVPYPGPLKKSEAKKLEKLDSKFFKQSEKTEKLLAGFVRETIGDFAILNI